MMLAVHNLLHAESMGLVGNHSRAKLPPPFLVVASIFPGYREHVGRIAENTLPQNSWFQGCHQVYISLILEMTMCHPLSLGLVETCVHPGKRAARCCVVVAPPNRHHPNPNHFKPNLALHLTVSVTGFVCALTNHRALREI